MQDTFIHSLHEYYYSVISLQASRTLNIVTTRQRSSKLCASGVWKLENIPPYEISVSTKRPRKEVRLQVTLEGGYSSRVSDKSWKHVPDTCPSNRKSTVADCHSTGWRNHQRKRGCWTQPPSRVAVSHIMLLVDWKMSKLTKIALMWFDDYSDPPPR